MNIQRTIVIGVAGGALAAWFATASTSAPRPRVAPSAARTAAVDKSGAELAAEIGRLHERLHPTAVPDEPSRDLFAFGNRSSVRQAPADFPALAAPLAEDMAAPLPVALTLIGVAEDSGVRTAIVSGPGGQLFLVKAGDAVGDRYTVAGIEPSAVDLTDSAGNAGGRTVRLVLK
jgi:hypothetical protein